MVIINNTILHGVTIYIMLSLAQVYMHFYLHSVYVYIVIHSVVTFETCNIIVGVDITPSLIRNGSEM
jgi:hypothetical protein